MAVKITKPEINVREKLAELDKPSGIAGEEMLRAETPQEQFNLISAGRRNMIINGDMQVSQRGTVTGINSATTNYGATDRHAFYVNGNGATFTSSQEESGPPGFTKTTLIDCTTANSSALTATQEIKTEYAIEAYDISGVGFGTTSAQPLTISFWCKTNQTGNFVLWVFRPDGTRNTSIPVPVHSANTWEYKTVTIQPDTSNTVAIDNSVGMYVSMILNTGSGYTSGTSPNGNWETIVTANRYVGCTFTIGNSTSDYFEYTGLQVETGKVATPFEHRSYGQELALCQRYYYRIGSGSADDILGMGGNLGTTTAYFSGTYPVEMRTTPTITVNNFAHFRCHTPNGSGLVPTAFSATSENSNQRWYVNFTLPSAQPAGAANLCMCSNNAGDFGIVSMNAEL
jgi:hypothetical protein